MPPVGELLNRFRPSGVWCVHAEATWKEDGGTWPWWLFEKAAQRPEGSWGAAFQIVKAYGGWTKSRLMLLRKQKALRRSNFRWMACDDEEGSDVEKGGDLASGRCKIRRKYSCSRSRSGLTTLNRHDKRFVLELIFYLKDKSYVEVLK